MGETYESRETDAQVEVATGAGRGFARAVAAVRRGRAPASAFPVGDLAREYGFTDVDGTRRPLSVCRETPGGEC